MHWCCHRRRRKVLLMAMLDCRECLCGLERHVASLVGRLWLCGWDVPSDGGEADGGANGLCIGNTGLGLCNPR